MNSLARRVVSGSILSVTDRDMAKRNAVEHLKRDPQQLIDELEQSIKWSAEHGHVSGHARGGEYTPEVVQQVGELYQGRGWKVDFSGYWLALS